MFCGEKFARSTVLAIVLFCAADLIDATEVAGHIYGKDWGYEYSIAPDGWPEKFKTCAGLNQSPINIDMSRVVANSSLGRILLIGFKEKRVYNIKNIGSTVLISPANVDPPIGLREENGKNQYRLHSVHFHWTSEHAINSQYYSMEAHMVTYNEKYPNITTALTKADGLEVLSTMFALSPYSNNANLEVLTDAVAHILEPDFSINVTMSLQDILPNYISAYFRYFGSLTIPPCEEIVTWTIFYPPNYIGPSQLKLFRVLHRVSVDNKIESWRKLNNRRPLQKLNHRAVQMYTTSYTTLYAG